MRSLIGVNQRTVLIWYYKSGCLEDRLVNRRGSQIGLFDSSVNRRVVVYTAIGAGGRDGIWATKSRVS